MGNEDVFIWGWGTKKKWGQIVPTEMPTFVHHPIFKTNGTFTTSDVLCNSCRTAVLHNFGFG